MSAPLVSITLSGSTTLPDDLGHLAAVAVQREAVGGGRLVRCLPTRAAGLQQRGLEPAAMLVGALQHQVGAGVAEAHLGDEGVGAAAVEPHVQDVLDRLPLGRVAVGAEEG